jgi:ribosomal protein S1
MLKILLVLALIFIGQTTNAEIIKLTTGQVIKAKILEKNNEQIIVDTGIGHTAVLKLDLIDTIEENPEQEGKKFMKNLVVMENWSWK